MIAPTILDVDPLPGEISAITMNIPAPRVLVVDDERLVRWAVAETLGECGYEVSEAEDADSTRRVILADRAPELVLLDLRLPDSNDLHLARFIRAHAPSTPIILMTGYGTPEIFTDAAALGISIVVKPFDLAELMSTVGDVLASRSE